MGLKLFDSDGSGGEADKIEIDEDFARRYEHNKKREDLQRLAELKKIGVVDSESDSDESSSEEESEEDEEDADLGKKRDLAFFNALIRVKNKDPILKDKDAKLFKSDFDEENDSSENGNEDEGNVSKEKKKKKPMYLKDVMSKHLIEEGPEFEDAEDDVGGEKVKSYSEEQEEMKKDFLKAVEEQEDGDGEEFFREKKIEKGQEDEHDLVMGEKLDEYFGGDDDKLDETTVFLKDYFRKRMWVGKGDDKKGMDYGEERLQVGVSEDEEEIERQEDYEREYNFRYEENTGDRVLGHSRVVQGSVRKKANTRKLQRERKEERMAQAAFEKKEDLKHLKNLKKKEMMEKLRKIREAAGIGEDGAWFLEEDDLEEEFDPDEYDKKMKETFDDGYYVAEDIDPDFGSYKDGDENESEKPDFDKEDELLGLCKDWDDIGKTRDGFLSARERILKLKGDNLDIDKPVDEEEDAAHEDSKRKRKRKRKISEVEKAVTDQLLEEYYKLEYEGTIGDLKTRFKYKEVNPSRYGLSAEELLMMDDKELNQYVSIKKLAPYKEQEYNVTRIKVSQQRQKNRELLVGGASDVQKTKKNKMVTVAENPSSAMSCASSEKPKIEGMNGGATGGISDVGKTKKNKMVSGAENPPSSAMNSASSEKPQMEVMNGGATIKLSRHAKRRRRQAEFKLSLSRRLAYGKILLKSKSKKKS